MKYDGLTPEESAAMLKGAKEDKFKTGFTLVFIIQYYVASIDKKLQ